MGRVQGGQGRADEGLGWGVGEGWQGEEGAAEGVDFVEVRLMEVEDGECTDQVLLSVFLGVSGTKCGRLSFAKHIFTQKGRQDTDVPELGFRFSGVSSELTSLWSFTTTSQSLNCDLRLIGHAATQI